MKKWKLAIIILLCIVLLVALWFFIIHPKLSWLSGERLARRLTWLGCDFSDCEKNEIFYNKLRDTVKHYEADPDDRTSFLFAGYTIGYKYEIMVRDAVRKYYGLKPDPIEYP